MLNRNEANLDKYLLVDARPRLDVVAHNVESGGGGLRNLHARRLALEFLASYGAEAQNLSGTFLFYPFDDK